MVEFSAKAYDEHNIIITDEDTDFEWYADEGTITDDGTFEETEAGSYYVTAEYEGVASDPTTVTVEKCSLTISIEGEGSETKLGEGEHDFDYGEEIDLEAEPEPEEWWEFSGWKGDVPEGEEENKEITITMDDNKDVVAHFKPKYQIYGRF